jgi:ComF family protein
MTQGTTDDTHMCGNCLQDAPPYNQARSWFHYEAPITTLLHRLKFLGDSGAVDTLAKLILWHAQGFDPACYDCVIPVPLHPSRLRQRGLNQSMVLARALFAANRSALLPVTLKKTRDTVAQTGLDGVARRKNLSGAFVLSPQSSVVGQHVCLIDDVFTTGTTVAECTRVLKNGGAASVDVWTVARA